MSRLSTRRTEVDIVVEAMVDDVVEVMEAVGETAIVTHLTRKVIEVTSLQENEIKAR